MPEQVRQDKEIEMTKLYFVTGNAGKFAEVSAILKDKYEVEQIKLDLDEIQALKSEDVIKHKAEEAHSLLHFPVLVEDTALYIRAWKNLPGALTKWFLEAVGTDGICKMMANESNREAFAETVFGLYDGGTLHTFLGRTEGTIAPEPKGENGFGWDSIFIPQDSKLTFAEMSDAEKSTNSMRAMALKNIETHLRDMETTEFK
jgi:XTP/dITP diphosphohydrolase